MTKEYEVLDQQGLIKMLEYLLTNLAPMVVSPLTLELVISEIEKKIKDLEDRIAILEQNSVTKDEFHTKINELENRINAIIGSDNTVNMDQVEFSVENGDLILRHPDGKLPVSFEIDEEGDLQMIYDVIKPDLCIEDGNMMLTVDES